MDIRILKDKENPLLKRREIVFQVNYKDVRSTPARMEVKENLARILNNDAKLIFIRKIKPKTGTQLAVGWANIYDSLEQAKLIEPEYIIKRNMPEEKKESEQ